MTSMRSGFRPQFQAIRPARLLPALLLAACQGPAAEEAAPPPPVEPEEPAAPAVQETDPLELAREALAAGDWNTALNRIEDARGEHGEEAGYWLLYGDTLLSFVAAEIATGQAHPGVIEGSFLDADHAFGRAAELAPGDWRAPYGQVRGRRASGAFEGAWEAAEATLALQPAEQAAPEVLVELGRAGLALTIERLQAEAGIPRAARVAESLLEDAAQAGSEEAPLVLSDLLAWQNHREDARAVLVARLVQAPRDTAAIERLKNLHGADAAGLALDLERVRHEQPGDAFLLWYLGEARYRHHLAMVAAGDFLQAYEAVDRAEECFLQSMALEEGFASSCADWLFLVRNARGWALWNEGRVDDAGQAFLASLDAAPERLEAEPGPGSLRLGIEAVMGHYFARERDMVKARAFLRRVVARHDAEAMWWNNLGLACRDIAEPRARPLVARGEMPEGELLDMLEESWDAYSRAVELAPDDPNIVNDHALIAVYYLDHDLEVAEAGLRHAIEVGTAAIASVDREADPETWQRMDMAIGDAWENLAYLDLVRFARPDRAPDFLEQSSQHYPWENRGGVQMLRQLLDRLQAAESGDTSSDGTDN